MYYLPEYLRKQTGRKRSAEAAGIDEEITTNPKKSRIDENDDVSYFNTIFPEEIKSLVFEKLSFKDLMTSSFVCKEWNTRIANNKKLTGKMVYKYQNNANQVDGGSEFTRQYVNFKFQELPAEIEFEQKFGHMRQFVKSITIHVNDEFITVKRFLESFPNLTSLELVEDDELDSSFIFPFQQQSPILELQSLQDFKILADSIRFTRKSLAVISSKIKLKSLELKNRQPDDSASSYSLYSNKLCFFLNNQTDLKCLTLDQFVPMPQSGVDGVEFNPNFSLEKLIIRNSPSSFVQGNDQHDTLEKLLGSCLKRCITLEMDIKDISHLRIFSSALGNFEKLENLKLNMQYRPECITTASFYLINNMKCQLKNLVVGGNIGNHRNREHYSLEFLLNSCKSSLETLTLHASLPCEDFVWNRIGQAMKKLKVLRVPKLAKTALNRFKGSSIEKLMTTTKAPIRKEDETFWAHFRSRNPNFKSIDYESSIHSISYSLD